MEITISVPRTFDIDLIKFREYLLSTGWKHTTMYWDSLERFEKLFVEISIPYPNSELIDKDNIVIMALKLLATHENKDIETIIALINR